MFGTPVDADFYRLIHQLVGSQAAADGRERRRNHREPFRSSQRIAPLNGSGFPSESDFFPVWCYDLSRGGFSFVARRRPEFTSLVAAFGTPPDVIHLAAEVVHCVSVLVHSSGLVEHIGDRARHAGYRSTGGKPATPVVLVGCRFTGRLQKPPARSGAAG